MKTLFATVAVCSALIGIIPAASGQGNVTFTPINSATYSNYLGQASWVAQVDTRGGWGFGYPIPVYAYNGSFGNANQTSIQLTDGNGTASLSYLILSGQFGSTGESQSSSISSLSPVGGIVIGVFSPLQPNGFGQTANVSDLYIGSNYEPSVADTATSTFSGMLCSFQNPTSQFNLAATLNTDLGSASQIYIFAIPAAVPEPSTIALAGLGGLALFFIARRKNKSVQV